MRRSRPFPLRFSTIRAPGALTPEELDTAVRRFKKAIIERALGTELSHHLGYVAGGSNVAVL